MRTGQQWKLSYRLVQKTEWGLVVALALVGWAMNPATVTISSLLRIPPWLLTKILISLPFFASGCGALLFIARYARAYIGHPNTWEQVQAILDQLHEDLYGNNEPKHYNQITLFKRRRWKWRCSPWRSKWLCGWGRGQWPWSGWLVPVARSGHGNKKSRGIFLAPSNSDGAEGIAGTTWACGQQGFVPVVVENLPRLTKDSPQADKELYAEKTSVTLECVEWYIQQKEHFSQSYAGRPVEVNGKPWGAIVIDSRSENLPDREKLNQVTNTAVRLLGVVLKGT